ncbi:helix-turn-helix domain-containing protein [Alkalibacterium kapii]|uniref:Mga helix-turn-helix domain-containing protein n=1 Tax=Alkalibacterium kapii TaxID=426704 RepID=A0A511AVJ2_9LACT|nr:helix-turn-helix domain-containing protein [Alkalibacterium kapii]GEK92215.1 hypothetical protein AKA01nite_18370 [Alkalibacterium kapii]
MWKLIPEKERKQYTIIEHLFFAEKTLTLEELTVLVDSSKRTVSDYIDELKIRVSNIGGSINSLAEGYSLDLPENVSIDAFQHKTLRSSPSLQLLEKLLLKNEMTGLDLENELHISSSTLSRMITILKKELSDYGLILETRPYQITGDEFLVRRFFTSYFLEVYGYQNWPLPSIDYYEIEKLIASLAKIDSIQFDTVNVQKFVLFTAVSIVRERFYRDLNDSELTKGSGLTEEFKNMHLYVDSWLKTVDISSDKKQLYGKIYTSYMFYYFRSYIKNIIPINRPDYTETIKEGLCDIAKSFDLPIADFTHIATKIDDMMYQYSKTAYAKALNTYLIFKPADYNLLRETKEQYPDFNKTLIEFLNNIYSFYDIKSEKINTEELLYLILSRWKKLFQLLYENYTSCHILVYSPLGYRHADNIARFLQAKLESACRVSIYNDPFLNKQRLNNYSFDILVSSITLTLDIEQPVVSLHSNITSSQLKPLFSAINDTFKKNRRKKRDEEDSMD